MHLGNRQLEHIVNTASTGPLESGLSPSQRRRRLSTVAAATQARERGRDKTHMSITFPRYFTTSRLSFSRYLKLTCIMDNVLSELLGLLVEFLRLCVLAMSMQCYVRAIHQARRGDNQASFMSILLAFFYLALFVALRFFVTVDSLRETDSDASSRRPPPGPDAGSGASRRTRGPNSRGRGYQAQRGIGRGRGGSRKRSSGSGRDAQKMLMLIMCFYLLQFVSSRGNEYFCEIDEDYLTDRFNLTGLNTEVSYYQYALDLVTDVFDLDADDDLREQIEKSARHLYGLVHARYIVSTRGLAKMVCFPPWLRGSLLEKHPLTDMQLEKYKKSDFGKCPRVMCDGHALLPLGQSDLPNQNMVKLYCPKCEDIYNPKSTRHSSIDGAYFGTSFHSILFQVYPALNPEKSSRRYEPRIYGFKVHAAAALARYQDNQREDLKWRLGEVDIKHRFIEDSESDEDAFEYDDYPADQAQPANNQMPIGGAPGDR